MMDTLAAQSGIAFAAGMVLNFMPCVLPVMPFKVQALLRETSGTTHSRTLAAAALLAGSLALAALAAGHLLGCDLDAMIRNLERLYGDEVVIDLHSANQFNVRDGFINSAMLYMEHFPYITRLWFGEYFDYDQDQDGLQDLNEPGYNGATVDLYDNASCTGAPIASTH